MLDGDVLIITYRMEGSFEELYVRNNALNTSLLFVLGGTFNRTSKLIVPKSKEGRGQDRGNPAVPRTNPIIIA